MSKPLEVIVGGEQEVSQGFEKFGEVSRALMDQLCERAYQASTLSRQLRFGNAQVTTHHGPFSWIEDGKRSLMIRIEGSGHSSAYVFEETRGDGLILHAAHSDRLAPRGTLNTGYTLKQPAGDRESIPSVTRNGEYLLAKRETRGKDQEFLTALAIVTKRI